ncbi:MAG: NAD(P)/FAD-dependent oxidoreductase [Methylocystaceae bacterium]
MEEKIIDLIVVGSGPAGLSAAINAKIRRLDLLVIGEKGGSHRLRKAPLINNYLGLPNINGNDLQDTFFDHAQKLGIEIMAARVDSIIPADDYFILVAGEEMLNTRTVILATGIPYRPSLAGENQFLGNGLGYCATCDGPLYQGKTVAIIGRNQEAEAEAIFMADVCQTVYYLPRYRLTNTLDDRIKIVPSEPKALKGDAKVTHLVLKDGELEVDGVFIIGAEAAPDRLVPGLALDDIHIGVNRDQATNLPGLFAAGDCTGSPYQIARAVGEGLVAGLNAAHYITAFKSNPKA